MKVCSKCQKEFNDDFKFCPFCGNRQDGKKVCSNCKEEMPEDFLFCYKCGYSFNNRKADNIQAVNNNLKTENMQAVNNNQNQKTDNIQPENSNLNKSFDYYYQAPVKKPIIKKQTNKKFDKCWFNYIFHCLSLCFSFAMIFILLFSPIYKLKMDVGILSSISADGDTEISIDVSFIDIVSAGVKSLTYDEKDWEDYQTDSATADAITEITTYLSTLTQNSVIDFDKLEKLFNKINFADALIATDSWEAYGNASILSYQFLALSIIIIGIMILNLLYFIFSLIKVITLDKSPVLYKMPLSILLLIIGTLFTFNIGFEAMNSSIMSFQGPYFGAALIVSAILYFLILGMSISSKIIFSEFKIKLKKIIFSASTLILSVIVGFGMLGGVIYMKAETSEDTYKATVCSSSLVSVFDCLNDLIVTFNNNGDLEQAFPNIGDVFEDFKTESVDLPTKSFENMMFKSYASKFLNSYEIITNNLSIFILFIIICSLCYAGAILLVFALKYNIKFFFNENIKNIKKTFIFSAIAALCTIAVIICSIIFGGMAEKALTANALKFTFSISIVPILLLVLLGGIITLNILTLLQDKKEKYSQVCLQNPYSNNFATNNILSENNITAVNTINPTEEKVVVAETINPTEEKVVVAETINPTEEKSKTVIDNEKEKEKYIEKE